MALISCPECHRQISSEASTCPHCGSPTTHRKNRQKLVWLLIIAVVLVGIGIAVFVKRQATRAENEAAERNLINAVVACGGNVQEELKAASSLHERYADLTYAEAYNIHTAAFELKCNLGSGK